MGVRETKKEQRREDIESAGLALFISEGYDRASVERIVAAAGIARGTFYLYFKDKQALFEHLAEKLYAPLVTLLEEHQRALADAGSTTHQQALYMRMATGMVEQVVALEPLALLHFREAWSAGPAGETVRLWRSRIEGLAKDILIDAANRGFVRTHEPLIVAMAIVGAAERIAWAWISSDVELDKSKVAAELSDLFWRGIHG
ncbi:MAG: TetR/AcrR family transcriptional regulator [Myxococcota bacterium]|nr:TetR/AcrR family transcriptional regulator [Myxococcota bacterium]